MFDLKVDVYQRSEGYVNGEPVRTDPVLVYADVPFMFGRLSGTTRYLAAGEGVALDARGVMDWRTGIDEKCQLQNVRTREGLMISGQPNAYRIRYVGTGRRRHHLELDLEALR